LAGQVAIAIDNTTLYEGLQRATLELAAAYDATIEGWSKALDLRDRETEGHTKRVTEMTLRLAHAIGVHEKELLHMQRGALLHDIGKMGVPDHILLKPDKLTEEEWEVMRKHPVFAYEMLSPIAYLRPALDIPYCHHEKWDGTGYPRGLKGEQIPLAARIFAVVDVWDALISDRPYRKGWTREKARAYLLEQAGAHFDPRAVDAFLAVLDEDEIAKPNDIDVDD
jgi:putative nucleotidyltransferase with HDIG domain